MSRREYLIQKGLQVQQLNKEAAKPVATSPRSFSSSKISKASAQEVAKIRDLFPPGTDDPRIAQILQQTQGNEEKLQLAMGELWDEYNAQEAWATVSKKQAKKKEEKTPANTSKQHQSSNTTSLNAEVTTSATGGGGRGRGGTRGRGGPATTRGASRGGRGGGRGRSAPAPQSSIHNHQELDPAEDDKDFEDRQKSEIVKKQQPSHKQQAVTKQPSLKKPTSIQPAITVPGLQGSWAQKPSFVTKHEPAPASPKQPPLQQKQQSLSPKPAKQAPAWETSNDAKLFESDVNSNNSAASPANWGTHRTASPTKKAPKKEIETEKLEPEAKLAQWGASINESKAVWSAPRTSPSPIASNSLHLSPRSNPTFGSPNVQTPIQQTPVAKSSPQNNSFSPKDSHKFSMGRWENVVETEMSLQFGSFSLEGDTTSAPSNNTWGTQGNSKSKNTWAASPKKAQESPSQVKPIKSPAHGAAPPGLSSYNIANNTLSSPRQAASSPRKYTPAAPSPASLPKPDDVNKPRQMPKYNQPGAASTGNLPVSNNVPSPNLGMSSQSSFDLKSSNLYPSNPSAYNQYSVGIASGGVRGAASSSAGPGAMMNNMLPIGPNNGNVNVVSNNVHSNKMQPNPNISRANANPGTGSQAAVPASQGTTGNVNPGNNNVLPHQAQQSLPHNVHQPPYQQVLPGQQQPQNYHPHFAPPPPPPGMAMPYNPYNYGNYYQQGYGYYQNPQYPQYSPRQQYPPRGNMPYGMEGFSNPPNVPLAYQDQHQVPHQEYGNMPQGFGEFAGGYLPNQQQVSHHNPNKQGAPQSQLNARPESAPSSYPSQVNARENTGSSPVPSGNVASSSYQHYGNWGGNSYNQPQPGSQQQPQQHHHQQQQQPIGGWGGHGMQPGSYPHQQPQQHHQGNSQPGGYRPYNGNTNAPGNANEANQGPNSTHSSWSS